MSAAAAEAIVTALGRKVLPIQGDGNCLFLTFGYYFHGSEMMHCKTRMLLSYFVATNRDRFKAMYWIVISKTMSRRCIISQCGELK